ncbi:hypothetical protein L596_022715 [Steinernema carpocapsae]|uniref:C-type lectin domain-containing protein n=1 Tax=Steinernema carpocapsae TaxID=34508 RepID=A0A4U5MML0_STECR|nr:hypothetical protein L596_022715 [Steinernema carpocapsae]
MLLFTLSAVLLTTVLAQCPKRSVLNPTENTCLTLIEVSLDYFEAETSCAALQGQLLKPTKAEIELMRKEFNGKTNATSIWVQKGSASTVEDCVALNSWVNVRKHNCKDKIPYICKTNAHNQVAQDFQQCVSGVTCPPCPECTPPPTTKLWCSTPDPCPSCP